MCGSPAVFPPYRQVPGRSVLSRVCLREDRYILRWPSVVLRWLRIGRYVADTIRQLPLAAGPSLSRINQVLFTNVPTVADNLSKYGCFDWIYVSLPLCPFVLMGTSSSLGCGISAISNQLVAGSIIVMHIKSITVLSLPLMVYGPRRPTHNTFQGVVMASFASSFPYL